MAIVYEYRVLTVGASSFSNLEAMGKRLQGTLNDSDVNEFARTGWELWQTHVLNDSGGINGVMLVFRRPKD